MKIYDAASAPNPRLVRIFVAEKGLDVAYQPVDIASGENRRPEFRAINPLGTLPVLELDDGTRISESAAICRYFEELQPEPPLMGRGPEDAARVEMWRRRVEFELALPVMDAFRHRHEMFAGRIAQSPEYARLCRDKGLQSLDWLDGVLARQPFVAGERFTIADITALVALDFGRVSRIRPDQRHAHLRRWHEAVSARPSAAA